jgi:hypothetical protein
MGLFSKNPKSNPAITVEGIQITFDLHHKLWEFTYLATDFVAYSHDFTLPPRADLDSILKTIEALKPEMLARLQKEFADWDDAKLNDGESYVVNVHDFTAEKSFIVSWSDGKSWGDMGVDFTIQNQTIIYECWGD